MEWVYHPISRMLTIESVITSFDTLREKSFYFDGEMHDFWEMVYVAGGDVSVSADERIYHMPPGTMIFHKPMEFHRIWGNRGTAPHIRIISFRASGAYMRRFENTLLTLSPEQSFAFAEIVKAGMVWLDKCDNRPQVVSPLEGQRIATDLEQFLLNLSPDMVFPSPSVMTGSKNETFQHMLQVMHEHCTENLQINDLAELCQMSPSNFKKIFHAYYAQGVMNYFTKLKIREAAKKLRRGMPVGKVSELCGFSSQNYFSVVFKREMDCTPSAYVRNCHTLPLDAE